MLSTLPLMALVLVQYTMVSIEAPVAATLGGATTSVQSASDLEDQIGDLVLPQEESKNTTATTAASKQHRGVPNYATLLEEIGDFTLPSNITAGHVAKAAKYVVRSTMSLVFIFWLEPNVADKPSLSFKTSRAIPLRCRNLLHHSRVTT